MLTATFLEGIRNINEKKSRPLTPVTQLKTYYLKLNRGSYEAVRFGIDSNNVPASRRASFTFLVLKFRSGINRKSLQHIT